MTPEEIEEKAQYLINGPRAADYGPAKEHFSKIAKIATHRTGKDLTPEDIIDVMIAVKEVRESYKHKDDNLVDKRGYELLRDKITNR